MKGKETLSLLLGGGGGQFYTSLVLQEVDSTLNTEY